MTKLSDQVIIENLYPYYPITSTQLCDQIRCYIDLLLRWNARLSLTTITEPRDILRFHFGESLFAVDIVPIRHGRLADVGSGAGFPAIPIRMVNADISMTLLEANQKKRVFLSEVCRSLDLVNVEVFPGRMQDLNSTGRDFSAITSRAFKVGEELLHWSSQQLSRSGLLILWTSASEAEKIALQHRWLWKDPIPVPESSSRVILIGSEDVTFHNVPRGTT
jgi:16S rRNA (guanine527-N7)-methyltransferase